MKLLDKLEGLDLQVSHLINFLWLFQGFLQCFKYTYLAYLKGIL